MKFIDQSAEQFVPRIGIDIGGSSVKAAVQIGNEIHTSVSSCYEHPNHAVLASRIREAVGSCWNKIFTESDKAIHDDSEVCISVPGPVDDNGVLLAAANLSGIINTHIPSWSADVLGLRKQPVVITDTLAAAYYEYHCNPFQGRSLYLSIGTGVGGIILDSGCPLIFTRGTCGHLGHIDVSGDVETAPYRAGSGRGSLEAYIGYRALMAAGVPADETRWANHPAARPALQALVRALRTMLVIFRPGEIVLMGGVGITLERALTFLEEQVRRDLSPAAPVSWMLRCSKSDHFAAALGACQTVNLQNEQIS